MKVTRAQWASRPFAKCTIEVDPNPDVQLQCKRDPLDQKRAAKCKVKVTDMRKMYVKLTTGRPPYISLNYGKFLSNL